MTALGSLHLGIIPDKNSGSFYKERFVIIDCDSIPAENFCVFQSNARETEPRIVKAYFICLMPNEKFELCIQKKGKMDPSTLLSSLKRYSFQQIDELKKYLRAFAERDDEAAKAFSDSLDFILDKSNDLKEDESLINIGLGGGNWFKVSGGKPSERPAHTGFTFGKEEKLRHMGWCKVKIQETN